MGTAKKVLYVTISPQQKKRSESYKPTSIYIVPVVVHEENVKHTHARTAVYHVSFPNTTTINKLIRPRGDGQVIQAGTLRTYHTACKAECRLIFKNVEKSLRVHITRETQTEARLVSLVPYVQLV